MTFLIVDVVAVAIGVGALVGLRRFATTRFGDVAMPGVRVHLITVVLLVALTIVFDSVMVMAGFTHYDAGSLTGLRLWLAPIEDLAYPAFATLVLPTLYVVVARMRGAQGGRDGVEDVRNRPVDVVDAAAGLRGWRAVDTIVRSSRPYSWVNTAYPFGLAYLLSGGRATDGAFVVGVLLFLLPYNLLMYGINDVFDYESDRRNPRKAGIEGVVLDPSLHRAVVGSAFAVILPFVLVFAWLGTEWSTIALIVCLFMVLAYSVPILRFKERALVDSIASSSHFVGPAVVGVAAIRPDLLGRPDVLAILGAFFAWGMASHLLGAVQDTAADREAGIGSTATRWGARVAARIAVVGYALAGLLMGGTGWPTALFGLLAIPYVVIAAPFVNVRDEDAASAHGAWRSFLWLNPAVGAAVTIGVLALVVTH